MRTLRTASAWPVVISIAWAASLASAADPPAPTAAREPDLPIPGPETTRNVGPVRNGLVDYLAVVNRHIGAVASPKENSFALISAIFGGVKAGFVGRETPEKWLQLPADAFKGQPFVQPNNVAEEDAEKHDEFHGAFQRAKRGPWDGPDFGPVRDWLETNDDAMSRFFEAVRTTKLRIPAVALEPEQPRLCLSLLPWPGAFRNMADAFAVRAYGSIARGDVLGALADIEIILRLGAQFDHQWTLVARLTGGMIRTKGYRVITNLVRSENVDAAILEQAQKLLDAQDPPLRPYVDTIVTATRWEVLDFLQRRAFGDMLHAALLVNTSVGDEPKLAPAKRAALNNRFRSVGWGYAMKEVNEVFDHIEWASTQPPAKGAALLRALQQQIPTDHHGGHLQRIADDPDAILRLGVRESGRELARAALATFMCDVPGFLAREAPVRQTRENVWQLVAERRAELTRARFRAQ